MNKKGFKKILLLIPFLIIVIYTIFPFLWFFIASLSKPGTIPKTLSLPDRLSFDAYFAVLSKRFQIENGSNICITSNILNSIIVAALTVILCLLISIGAAYVFSRYNRRYIKFGFNSLLVIRMTPSISLTIPIFLFFAKLNIVDKYIGLVLIHTLLNMPLAIWMIKGFIDAIPIELEEQAYIDGSSFMNILIKIIIPLAAPGIAVSACFIFLGSFNEYLFSIVLSRGSIDTLPLAIASFQADHKVFYNEMAAATFISMIPLTLFFYLMGKNIVKGISMGAVK